MYKVSEAIRLNYCLIATNGNFQIRATVFSVAMQSHTSKLLGQWASAGITGKDFKYNTPVWTQFCNAPN